MGQYGIGQYGNCIIIAPNLVSVNKTLA